MAFSAFWQHNLEQISRFKNIITAAASELEASEQGSNLKENRHTK